MSAIQTILVPSDHNSLHRAEKTSASPRLHEYKPYAQAPSDARLARMVAGLRGLAIDTSVLRSSRDFRLLFAGQAVNLIGGQIRMVAMPYLVFLLTHSSLAVGLLGLALVFLAIAGSADMFSAIFRSTILQMATPDRLRGRLSAIDFMVISSGPRLGDLESGSVATLTNVQFAAWSGGLAALIGAVIIAFAIPAFARYDAREAFARPV